MLIIQTSQTDQLYWTQSITPISLSSTSSCVLLNVNLKIFIISLDFNHIKWHRLASSIKLFAFITPLTINTFHLVSNILFFWVITCLHLRDWFIEIVCWMNAHITKRDFLTITKRFIDQTVCYVENVNNWLVPR